MLLNYLKHIVNQYEIMQDTNRILLLPLFGKQGFTGSLMLIAKKLLSQICFRAIIVSLEAFLLSLSNLTIMGMNTQEYIHNYFGKYKCKLLTLHHRTPSPQSMTFRNLIAKLHSLLPLRLVCFLESKSKCLRPTTFFSTSTQSHRALQ